MKMHENTLIALMSYVLIGLVLGQTPFGIPEDAIEFSDRLEPPTPNDDIRFGSAIATSWPLVVVGETGAGFLNGIIHVFHVNQTDPDEALVPLGQLITTEPNGAKIGQAVSITSTRPGDWAHFDDDESETWWIVVPGETKAAIFLIHPSNTTAGEFDPPELFTEVNIVSGCATEIPCVGAASVSFRGYQLVLGAADATGEMWLVSTTTGTPQLLKLQTFPPSGERTGEEWASSVLSTYSGNTLIGSPNYGTSLLNGVGRVAIWNGKDEIRDLNHDIQNTQLTGNRFGSAMAAPPSGQEGSFVVTSPAVEPSLHVYSHTLDDFAEVLTPVEVGTIHNPYEDTLPWGTSVSADVYRTGGRGTGSGVGDLFVAVGASRSGVDRKSLVDVFIKPNIDDLTAGGLRKISSIYAPDSIASDTVAFDVAAMVNPDNGEVWIFATAPTEDGGNGQWRDSGAVWYTKVRASPFTNWARIFILAALAGVGLMLAFFIIQALFVMVYNSRRKPDEMARKSLVSTLGGTLRGALQRDHSPVKKASNASAASSGSAPFYASSTSRTSRGSRRAAPSGSMRSSGSGGSRRKSQKSPSKRSKNSRGSLRMSAVASGGIGGSSRKSPSKSRGSLRASASGRSSRGSKGSRGSLRASTTGRVSQGSTGSRGSNRASEKPEEP